MKKTRRNPPLPIGEKFGKLTIEADLGVKAGAAWSLCLCECGNHKEIKTHTIKNGKAKSCGCRKLLIFAPGTRFGILTVLSPLSRSEYGDSQSLCRCDCGTEKKILNYSLHSGSTKSCGCLRHRIKELSPGTKFGNWTVIGSAGFDAHGNAQSSVRCECGIESLCANSNLRRGGTKGCGCLQKPLLGNFKRLKYGEAAKNRVVMVIIRGALRRGLKFNLTKNQVKDMLKLPCHWCGEIEVNNYKEAHHYGEFRWNGIDRLNNSIGYELDNVVPCCGPCNLMRRNLTPETFIKMCNKVAQTHPLSKDQKMNQKPIVITDSLKDDSLTEFERSVQAYEARVRAFRIPQEKRTKHPARPASMSQAKRRRRARQKGGK